MSLSTLFVPPAHLIRGNFIHAPAFAEIEIFVDYLCAVDVDGFITHFAPFTSDSLDQLAPPSQSLPPLFVPPPSTFFIPGFVDTHIHAPQIAYVGTATDRSLMEWLIHYAFPTESAFEDVNFARKMYTTLVECLLANGTTTALYFATIHLPATIALADICYSRHQRAIIGKVNMDRNGFGRYIETVDESIDATKRFIDYVHSLQSNLIHPVITPRFIPACSSHLLKGLAQLYHSYPQYDVSSTPTRGGREYLPRVYIQSHLSESTDEVAWVNAHHVEYGFTDEQAEPPTDTNIFAHHGLLTSRSIFAHAVHISRDDMIALAGHHSSISHCPLSNAFFADGILPIQQVMRNGVAVGLGTDIAGGPSLSMLTAIRQAVITSRILSHRPPPDHNKNNQIGSDANADLSQSDETTLPLTYQSAFYLATLGGAKALSLSHVIGTFALNKAFDALLIDPAAAPTSLPVFAGEYSDLSTTKAALLKTFEKFINLADDRHIVQVYVQGQRVKTFFA